MRFEFSTEGLSSLPIVGFLRVGDLARIRVERRGAGEGENVAIGSVQQLLPLQLNDLVQKPLANNKQAQIVCMRAQLSL